MEKIKEFFTNHKKTLMAVGGIILAIIVWRKLTK
jgi:hypothetical protein